MYSILCAIGVVFVITFVPETKGRDLESIHKLFEKNTATSKRDSSVEARSKQGHDNVAMHTEDEILPCANIPKIDTKL